jgi:hypothetical protein
MRVNGRTLRPATLAERRLLSAFGQSDLRVPRGMNAFVAARRLGRLARYAGPDGEFLRHLLTIQKKPFVPEPSPAPDQAEPVELDAHARAA